MKTLWGRRKLIAETRIRNEVLVPGMIKKVNQILKDASDDDEEKALAQAAQPPKKSKYKFSDLKKVVLGAKKDTRSTSLAINLEDNEPRESLVPVDDFVAKKKSKGLLAKVLHKKP